MAADCSRRIATVAREERNVVTERENKKNILFVDDEKDVLDGLQNLLYKQRSRWNMVFALGGESALAELKKTPFDVIVSDMRMPGIDGATLLKKVRDDYPNIIRIVLSGHAERETILRAIPVAHQYLSKPCDAEALQVVIERAGDLHKLLKDDRIRNVIGKLDKLPATPRAYWELQRVVANPVVDIDEIAKIISQDPALSIKILQLVNSAYFGMAKHITSIGQAISYLGIDLLKGLTLTASIFAAMEERTPVRGFSLDAFQRHSILTARMAKQLFTDPKEMESAFTAGLVHDIGKIILAVGLPTRFDEMVKSATNTDRSFDAIEKEAIGVTHAEIGAYLLGIWGLPMSIVEAVAHHHNPLYTSQNSLNTVVGIYIADTLVTGTHNPHDKRAREDLIDKTLLESLGVMTEFKKWQAMAVKEAQTMNIANL